MKFLLIPIFLISDLAIARGQAWGKGPPLTPEEYSKAPGGNTVEQIGDTFYVPKVTGHKIGSQYLKINSDITRYQIKVMGSKRSDLPKGTILSQEPKAGSETLKPGEINVIISTGN